MNPSAERMFGYTAQEAVGHHITLIIPRERRAEEVEVIAKIRRGEKVRAGFDEHVAKPVDPDALFERIRVLAASRGPR